MSGVGVGAVVLGGGCGGDPQSPDDATSIAVTSSAPAVGDEASATPGRDGEWVDFTPVLRATGTDPTLSNDATETTQGRYAQGDLAVDAWWRIVFGMEGTDPGEGFYQLELPVPANENPRPIGSGFMVNRDGDATKGPIPVFAVIDPPLADSVGGDPGLPFLFLAGEGLFATGTAIVQHDVPFPWGAQDIINLVLRYEPG